jgi:hypothetical protein
LRYLLRITLVFVSALAFVTPASAEATILVTQPTDFWFDYSEPTLFVAITYQSDTFPSDPQLWLYTEDGVLIVTNDDFVGLQSRIEIEVPAGRYRLRASTCCYEPDVWRGGGEWNIQYELYYNGLQTDPTTTTEVTTSLPPEASTTTTQAELPTTTQSPGEPPSTTSSTTSIPETTTTWEMPTTSTELTTTSTTTVLTTTAPVTEVPPIVTTTTLVSENPQNSLVPTTSLSPFFPTPLTTTSPPTTTATTTIPPTSQPTETTSEPSQTAPDSPETTTTTLPPIVAGETVEPEIAVAYATDPEVLATVTQDEATEIFDAIIVDKLTPEQAAEIVTAVQDAPPEVREAFEEEINVFDGAFDTYVPLGSTVSVASRRTVTAATAAIGATIPVSNRRKTT